MSLQVFENSLLASNRERSTIKRYSQLVKNFKLHVGEKSAYTRQDVESYLAEMKRRGCNGTAMRFAYATLKQFFSRTGHEWPLETSEAPKYSETHVEAYTWDELEAILASAAESSPRNNGIMRD